jgi:hypothetical protein
MLVTTIFPYPETLISHAPPTNDGILDPLSNDEITDPNSGAAITDPNA